MVAVLAVPVEAILPPNTTPLVLEDADAVAVNTWDKSPKNDALPSDVNVKYSMFDVSALLVSDPPDTIALVEDPHPDALSIAFVKSPKMDVFPVDAMVMY